MPTNLQQLRTNWGENLRAARISAGLTQESLAASAGTQASTISRVEAGVFTPSDKLRPRIAAALTTATGQTVTVPDLFPHTTLALDEEPKHGPSGIGRVAAVAALGLAFLVPTASTPSADAAARGVCKPTLRPTLAATASWDGRTLILSGTVPSAVRGTVNTNIAIAGVGTAYNVGAPRAYRVTRAQARALNEDAAATATFHSFPSSFRPAQGQRLDGPSCSMRVA